MIVAVFVLSACATSSGTPPKATEGSAAPLSVDLCEHRVPAEECTQHNPGLVEKFKKTNDWCTEHDVPESHCHKCHGGLTFERLPTLPVDADLKNISNMGEDVPSLATYVVPGKVTVFEFYATWCAPCKKVDRHVYQLLGQRKDLAYRKINVMSWETPVAKRYLAKVPNLPYVVVYGRDGKEVRAIAGLDLAALDEAIALGARP